MSMPRAASSPPTSACPPSPARCWRRRSTSWGRARACSRGGCATIHELNLSRGFDAKAREMFGEGPLYVAFRPDAAFFAIGEDSRKAIKEALTAPATASAPLRLELSLPRLAVVMAKTPEQVKAARRLLTQNEEGRFRISLEG